MSNKNPPFTGSCLCGGVSYKIEGILRPVILCHCTQCRKTSGHYVAATSCKISALTIKGDTLSWYSSSHHAERGFCQTCGSNLFWRPLKSKKISVFAGTLDDETGLKTEAQIHPETKGDYYALPNVPAIKQSQIQGE